MTVKKFILVISLNLLCMILLFELAGTLVLASPNYFSQRLSVFRLYQSQGGTEKPISSDTLLLGCSVAGQLFPMGKRSNWLATGAPCLLAKSYIMANRALKANPHIKVIYIVTVPAGITHKFESKMTYGHFIKSFFSYANIPYLDWFLVKKIAQRPIALLSFFNFYKILPFSDINYDDGKPIYYDTLTDFGIFYLKKLREFSKTNHVELIFVASPVRESLGRQLHNYKHLRAGIHNNGFDDMFTGYFDHMVSYPDSCFVDGTHFKNGYLENQREEIVRRLGIFR
ncbi:MAG: hypothetical protein WCO44_06810 [Bacteroidota bacterium]